jgi:hypothetical protein
LKKDKCIEIDLELKKYLDLEKKYRKLMATKYPPDENDIKKVNISYSNLIREKFFLPLMYSGNRHIPKKKVKLINILENLIAIFKKLDPHSIDAPVWIKKMDIVYRSHYEKKDVDRGLDYLIKNGYIEEERTMFKSDEEKNIIQPYALFFAIDSKSGFVLERETKAESKEEDNPPKIIPIKKQEFLRPILPEEFKIEDIYIYSWRRNVPINCMPKILEDLKKKK